MINKATLALTYKPKKEAGFAEIDNGSTSNEVPETAWTAENAVKQ